MHNNHNPDYLGEFSQSDLEEIKSLLKKILEALQRSDLSQDEYPQVAAPVRAGQELMEMPKPPLGKIRDLLRPLAHVAQIADLVKKVLDLFSDG